MKRLVILALVFVLAICLLAACGEMDMSGSAGSGSTAGSTGTAEMTTLPTASGLIPTDAMGGATDGSDTAMPRSPIPGMGR